MWRPSLLVILAATGFSSARAAPLGFDVRPSHVDGDLKDVLAADLDGDGRKDILAVYTHGLPPRTKRFVAVFFSDAAGQPAKPSILLPMDDRDTCAFDVANLDGLAGDDLVLIRRRGIWLTSFTARKASEPREILATSTLLRRASREQLPRLRIAHPLTGEKPDLLIPQEDALVVYRAGPTGYLKLSALDVDINASASTGRGIEIGTTASMPAVYAEIKFPTIQVADANADGRPDIFAAQEDRLRVFLQNESGGFAARASFSRDFAVRTEAERRTANAVAGITIRDLDGDGSADLLVRKQVNQGIASTATTSYLHMGKRSGRYDGSSNQVIENEGASDTSAILLDITGDGTVDLLLPSVDIGILAIIQMLTSKTVTITAQAYPFRLAQRTFTTSPVGERELSLPISLEGASDLPVIQLGDYNGDGRQDLAFGGEADALSIYLGVSGPDLFSTDAEVTVPVRALGRAESVDLTGNGQPGLLLFSPRTVGHKGELYVLWNRLRG